MQSDSESLASTEDSPALGGVVAATITPCRQRGEIDCDAAGHLYRNLAEHGCDGLFIVSSTGESVLVDEEDRRKLVATACEAVGGAATIYAGVSGGGVKQALRQARAAADEGADVAVAMTPFFLLYSQAEVIDYLTAIADGSPIPVALYHHPRATNPIEIDTAARLAEHPNIVAIKDTSASTTRARMLHMALAGSNVCVMQGGEQLLLESLKLGGGGMVTALAGVAPEWHAQLWRAFNAGDLDLADRMQHKISELWKMFEFPQFKGSLTLFSLSLKLSLKRRGWLQQLHGMVSQYEQDEALEAIIDEHLSKVDFADVPVAPRDSSAGEPTKVA